MNPFHHLKDRWAVEHASRHDSQYKNVRRIKAKVSAAFALTRAPVEATGATLVPLDFATLDAIARYRVAAVKGTALLRPLLLNFHLEHSSIGQGNSPATSARNRCILTRNNQP